ncbi:hypothetical protein LWX53_02600 [bacterium]|nr:hypothetical protein [bacterium]
MRKRPDGSLTYGIPLWYRAMTAAMIGLVVGGSLSGGNAPNFVAWIILAFLLFGLLYEERWIVDPRSGKVRHLGGVWPVAKATEIAFGDIESLRLEAFARGTVPGSGDEAVGAVHDLSNVFGDGDEAEEKARAFAMMRGKDSEDPVKKQPSRFGAKKPYINLVLKTRSGEDYLIDTLPARRAARFKKVGAAFAEVCGAPFADKG